MPDCRRLHLAHETVTPASARRFESASPQPSASDLPRADRSRHRSDSCRPNRASHDRRSLPSVRWERGADLVHPRRGSTRNPWVVTRAEWRDANQTHCVRVAALPGARGDAIAAAGHLHHQEKALEGVLSALRTGTGDERVRQRGNRFALVFGIGRRVRSSSDGQRNEVCEVGRRRAAGARLDRVCVGSTWRPVGWRWWWATARIRTSGGCRTRKRAGMSARFGYWVRGDDGAGCGSGGRVLTGGVALRSRAGVRARTCLWRSTRGKASSRSSSWCIRCARRASVTKAGIVMERRLRLAGLARRGICGC